MSFDAASWCAQTGAVAPSKTTILSAPPGFTYGRVGIAKFAREDHDEVLNKTNAMLRKISLSGYIAGCILGWIVFSGSSQADEAIPPAATTPNFIPLARDLIKALDGLGRYEMPKTLPPIVQISQDEVSMLICGRPCAVQAAYLPEWGIVMAHTLDPVNNTLDRSILLHELVHYVQDLDQRYATETPCKRWFHRENEAYSLQNSYLMSIHSLHHVGGMLDPSVCKDKPQDDKSNAFETD